MWEKGNKKKGKEKNRKEKKKEPEISILFLWDLWSGCYFCLYFFSLFFWVFAFIASA